MEKSNQGRNRKAKGSNEPAPQPRKPAIKLAAGRARRPGGKRSTKSAAHNVDGLVHDAKPSGPPAREFFVVGLGASAGGLEALLSFFAHTPADTGIAYVVVTHLAADRASLMPELLARGTLMPVKSISSGMRVERDTVFVVPPGVNLGIMGGVLTLTEIQKHPMATLPIDYFFRSLAHDQRENAIGIVLSGTGNDGTLGLKEIKGEGGMAMVQAEHSAKYTGMPHSAIVGDMVDYVLPVERMPRQLLAYTRGKARVTGEQAANLNIGDAMRRIFLLLRSRTGQDFSLYKASTSARRIERRMNVHHISTLDEYFRYLVTNAKETGQLFKELLINVTSFFRDPEAFELLGEKILPELLEKKPDGYVVRIWSTGCASGEEAYSIAIVLHEVMERMNRQFPTQIFATDLDASSIDLARTGVYPEGITADVSPKRLMRFFTKEDSTYRIKKEVREMVVFAPQNIILDPPFTKLDLLVCRNLLIYLESELQNRILPIFHYALNPGGILFLGSSESISGHSSLFDTIDRKWKFFRRTGVTPHRQVVDWPTHIPTEELKMTEPGSAIDPAKVVSAERVMLAKLVPPSIIVHEQGEIVHIHGRTGYFLEPHPGPQGQNNIFKMAREGLQLELSAAFRQAAKHDKEIVHRGVRVKTNGHHILTDIHVQRLSEPESFRGLFLVTFQKREELPAEGAAAPSSGRKAGTRIQVLEQELQHMRERNQAAVEELETTNEELKSTNEELQSTNEELQSSNEELETSREELQSLNEELQTVNEELAGKIDQLTLINDDMKNLLNSTNIATIFLDNDLKIKRFTEQDKNIVRVIASDVGRPIADLVSRLDYRGLVEDAREVLRTLVAKEAEVRGHNELWYLVRIVPYRTAENTIEGLVLTFVDITTSKILQEKEHNLQVALEPTPYAIFGQDKSLRYLQAYGRTILGLMPEEVVGKTDAEIFPRALAAKMAEFKRRALRSGKSAETAFPLMIDGRSQDITLFVQPIRDRADRVVGVMSITRSVEAGEPVGTPPSKRRGKGGA